MPRLDLDTLLSSCGPAVRKLNPGIFSAGGHAPAPKPQPSNRPRPLAARKAQDLDPRKRLVRITSFRVRLLDEDNLVAKWHVDSLRYSGILHGDDPSQARIETRQQKVAHRHEERTEIEVTILID
jgi:hypothetical protein